MSILTDKVGILTSLEKRMKTDSTETKSFRNRDRRLSGLMVKDLIRIRIDELGIDNTVVQKALGYTRPNVIAMMKTGAMRLPDNKAIAAAKVLQLDPVFLLGKVISESNAELWDSINSVMGDRLVTANEMKIIAILREQLNGLDINLAGMPSFVADMKKATSKQVLSQLEDVQAHLKKMDKESDERKAVRKSPAT
jgi:hypothetical protein